MKVKKLRDILSKYPDDMMINLLDVGTDDFSDSNYNLEENMIELLDYIEEEGDPEPAGKALFITFMNQRIPEFETYE